MTYLSISRFLCAQEDDLALRIRINKTTDDTELADPGHGVAEWRLDEPLPADLRAHDDAAARFDGADDDGVLTIPGLAHSFEHCVGLIRFHAHDSLALVGHFHGVDPQHIGRGTHVLTERERFLFDDDPDAALPGHLVQNVGHAAPGRVLHGGDSPDLQGRLDGLPYGGHVRLQFGAELEALSMGDNGDAVVADCAGDDDLVAGLQATIPDRVIGDADARRVDDDAVQRLPGQNFRITRD